MGAKSYGARTWHYIRTLAEESDFLKASELERLGISERCLRTATEKGYLKRVGPGLYHHVDHFPGVDNALLQLGMLRFRSPAAFVCGPSAAAMWDLLPVGYFWPPWIGIESKARPPEGFANVRRFSKKRLYDAITDFRIDKLRFRMSTEIRAIVELFQMRKKLGERLPRFALREWLKQPLVFESHLLDLARGFGLRQVVMQALVHTIEGELTEEDLRAFRRNSKNGEVYDGWVPGEGSE